MTIAQDIATKFTTLNNHINTIRTSIETKRGISLTGTKISGFAAAIDAITTGGGSTGYVRPAEWLAMPAIGASEQKCYIVYNVRQSMLGASFTCAGAYTVNWGDGVTENFASGANAQHTYTFANLTQVLASGEKQVLITITPQAGQNLTSISLIPAHSSYTKSVISGCVDLSVNAEFLTNLILQSVTAGTSKLQHLEILSLNKNNITGNFSQLCNGLYNLKSVPVLVTTTATTLSYAFKNCYGLLELPDTLDTPNNLSLSNFVTGCYSLKKVPGMYTGKVTDFSNMSAGCYSIQALSAMDYSKATNISNLALNCIALKRTGTINSVLATNVSSAFSGCASLVEVESINISAATNTATMFGTCTALEKANVVGTPISISYLNCNLGKEALVAIFTALPTVSNSSTITITGNPGVSALVASDNLIATSKGWTITP